MERTTVNLRRDYRALDRIMEVDHVILSHGDGTVSDVDSSDSAHWAPEIYQGNDDKLHLSEHASSRGWSLGVEYTSAHFVGGDVARNILDTPGYYVVLMVPDCDDKCGEDCEGYHDNAWAIAFRESE
jgi:hypothetical protein